MRVIKEKVKTFRDTLHRMRNEGIDVSRVSEQDYMKYVKTNGLSLAKPFKECGFECLRDLVVRSGDETCSSSVFKAFLKLDALSAVRNKFGSGEFTSSMVQRAMPGTFKSKKDIVPVLEECVRDGLIVQESKCRFAFSSPKQNIQKYLTCPIKVNSTELNNFDETFSEDDFSEEYRSELEEEVKKYSKFVVTTAVVDKPVNEKFLESIKNYAKRNEALVLILPSDIRNKKENSDIKAMNLDPKLKDFRIVYKDLYLNKNLCLCSIKTSAKQIKTLTGLDRIATKKDASIIVASTKQFEENVPTQKGKVPLRTVTTGAITVSNYDTDRYMSKRTAYLAEEDHMFGAAVVELVDDNLFHLRVIEGSKNDTFTDLGVEYKPDGSIVYLRDNVFVMGDSHTDRLNKKLHKGLMNMVDSMSIDTVVLHDIFNATSITHHDKGKNLTRAIKALENKSSLEKEGETLKSYLEDIKEHVRNIVVVNSNHDRHLETYLEEGRYVNDPINSYTAHKLAIAYMEKKNPLKYLLEDLLGLNCHYIKWLKQDEEFNRYGVELSAHGDSGCNGAKGSLVVFEKGIGNCVTAHTHSAKRLRRACCVGVTGELDQVYNKGMTTWSHTCLLLHSNGTKQLIHFIPDKSGNYMFTTNKEK